MRRIALAATVACVAALLATPLASGSWHYTFLNFFDAGPDSVASGKSTAKKCGPGGKQGTYNFRSFVGSSGGDTALEVEVTGKLSARDKFVRFKQTEVATDASPTFPPEVVDEVRNALFDFYETVFTRWKGPGHKMEVRHGSLVIFGSEAVESGESKTKFAPKPGC